MLARILAHPMTEHVIVGLIIINAITLGLETSPTVMEAIGPTLIAIDKAILTIFMVEILARIAVHRLNFFRDPWGWFDFLVVAIALVPATGAFSALRALRILRVLRLISVMPSLRRIVGGLIGALPGVGSVALLLVMILYVFAVIGTKLYGGTSPEQFGSLGATAYTLFQVMTFDDWAGGIVKPLLAEHPYAWVFFILFMIFSTFMVLNLLIGVVVSALDAETAEDAPKLTHPAGSDALIASELAALRAEVAALREQLAGPSREAA